MKLWLEDDLASKKAVIYRALIFSAVTLFVLILFQPFGTHNDPLSYKLLRLSGYGLVTFCALLLCGFLEIALTHLTLRKSSRLVLIPSLYVALTAVFNHSYFVVAILGSWHWQNQLLFVLYTLLIGLFPIGFLFIVDHHAAKITSPQQDAQVSGQTELSDELFSDNDTTTSPLVTLIGTNKDDKIQIPLAQILCVKSADNYCEVAILESAQVNYKLLRSSLTAILQQLPIDSLMYRCHRSYVVNLALVESSIGNAGGLQLSMKAPDVIVPVSRSYVDAIKQAL